MNLWIARDYNGALYIYDTEPRLDNGVYEAKRMTLFIEIPRYFYPEVTHQNSPKQLIVEN